MSSGLGVQDGAPSGVLHLSRSSSSVPSFSRVVHGDLAQCVAHCLFVHELARLARVSRDCLAHVQKKMEQFKAIDLTLYPMMSQRQFDLLCAGVSGVESLIFDVSGLAPRALIAGDPVRVDAADIGGAIDWTAYARFTMNILALVDRNAATLRVIHATHIHRAASASGRGETMRAFTQQLLLPLFRRAIALQSLEVFHLPTVLSFEAFLTIASRFALSTEHLFQKSRFSIVKQSLPRVFPCLRVLSGIVYPTLYVHRILPHFSSQMLSLRLCFPWHQQAGAEEQARNIREMCAASPHCALDEFLPEEEQPAGAGALTRSLSVERLNGIFPHFQGLLWLSLQLYESYLPHSVVRIDLPSLLQLTIDCDIDAHLADVEFRLPSLRTLNLNVELMCDHEEALRRIEARAIADEDEDDLETPMYILPPTLLASIAHSPGLRYLCLPLCGEHAEEATPDVRARLTPEMRVAMEAQAERNGRSSPFDEPVSRIRLLLYALSTMPFASDLRLFEDSASQIVSLREYFELFPRLGSFTSDPEFDEPAAPFIRPSGESYPLQLGHWSEAVLDRAKGTWDRLSVANQQHTRTAEEQEKYAIGAEAYLVPTKHYFSLAHRDARLALEDLHPIILTRFATLSILYLSSPTRVDPAAVHALIEHCPVLESLSLIQLVGVDDSCLYFPTGFTRPALKTFRLKNVCAVQAEISGVGALTVLSVTRGSMIFPNCTEVELLNFGCVSLVLATVRHLLETNRWPNLATLTVPDAEEDAAVAQSRAELRDVFFARASERALDPSAPNGLEHALYTVTMSEPVDTPFVDHPRWFMHQRVLQQTQCTKLPGMGRGIFLEKAFTEATCFADCCSHEAPPVVPLDPDEVPAQAIVALQLGNDDDDDLDEEEEEEGEVVHVGYAEEVHPFVPLSHAVFIGEEDPSPGVQGEPYEREGEASPTPTMQGESNYPRQGEESD